MPRVTYPRRARAARPSSVALRQRGFHEVFGPERDPKGQRATPAPLLPRTRSENEVPRRAALRRDARESAPGRDVARPLPHRSAPRFGADALPLALRAECGLPAARV